MFDQADAMKMPRGFVELRHEATHEELPSLKRLVYHTEVALDWLWLYYWANLDCDDAAHVMFNERREATDEAFASVLRNLVGQRLSEIKARTEPSLSAASTAACTEMLVLCRHHPPNIKTLASCLLDKRMMVPAGRR